MKPEEQPSSSPQSKDSVTAEQPADTTDPQQVPQPQRPPEQAFSPPPFAPNQTVAPSFMQPAPSAGIHTESGSNKRKKLIIITVVVALCLIAGGVATYFLTKREKDTASNTTTQSTSTNRTDDAELKTPEDAAEVFAGQQNKAKDAERSTDIKALYGQVEAYYAQNEHYPTFATLNTPELRAQNFPGLDEGALQDPDGENTVLVTTPTAKAYAYAVTNDAGASCEANAKTCTKHTLTAILSDGQTYVRTQLN